MAIVSVNEIGEGRSCTFNQDWSRTRTRAWQVITDNPNVGAVEVQFASGIPLPWTPYLTPTEYDLVCYAKTITPSQDASDPRKWIVTVTYETPSYLTDPATADPATAQNAGGSGDGSGGPGQGGIENPLNRPAKVSWDFERYQKIATKGKLVTLGVAADEETAIETSAGDKFDPPAEKDDSRPTLTITRNEAMFDQSRAYQYRDAVNSDTFAGSPPGTAKISGIRGDRQFENGNIYWEVTYIIQFRPEGWNLEILDLGPNYTNLDGTKVAFYDLTGTSRIDKKLDGSGNPLGDGEDDFYREWQIYPSLPFAPLGLE